MSSWSQNLAHLNPYEEQVLIDFFMYYMPMDQRTMLKQQFPVIYEKLYSKTLVHQGKECQECKAIIQSLSDKECEVEKKDEKNIEAVIKIV